MAVCSAASMSAHAFQFDTGNRDLSVRWDTNLKYTAAFRVKDQEDQLIADPNLDDGDRNFDPGLISNRVDVFTEFDADYKGTGVRVSAAAWYDDIYNQSNDNDSPDTNNSLSVPHNRFTEDTRELHGKDAEIRDAFVYGDFNITDTMWGAVRLGQHSVVYGESLFYGNNGVAAAQQPIDAIRALSVPNSQFKEVALPVNQVSADFQLAPNFSVGGYYQFEWERTRIPSAGSYFSPADLLDAGGESIIQPTPAGPLPLFTRGDDYEASDSGQFGLKMNYWSPELQTDFGLYAANYHDKNFQVQTRLLNNPMDPATVPPLGEHMLLFPEDIEVYGFSVNTGVGDANVGFEASVRHNAPLVSVTVTDPAFAGAPEGNNDSNPLYAVGKTAHAQVNFIRVMPGSALWDSATFLGELAWNRALSVDKNPGAVDPNNTRDATALRLAFTPNVFRVMDNVDMSVPMGASYGIDGRSRAVGGFSQEKGGDYNIGLAFDYRKRLNVKLSYNGYYGQGAPVNIGGIKTYQQTNADRDFISMNASYTF
ncbi:DUF1302 domain-containing protein [Marinobacter sp.]|uniref:DUF1302 domain-containing protein n=1 Tax=Marinobacter sp. TaxID=50741 RepID=UPI0034A4E520